MSLENKTWLQLKQLCDELKIDRKGNKNDLIERLLCHIFLLHQLN